jgi:hypothetical protein
VYTVAETKGGGQGRPPPLKRLEEISVVFKSFHFQEESQKRNVKEKKNKSRTQKGKNLLLSST